MCLPKRVDSFLGGGRGAKGGRVRIEAGWRQDAPLKPCGWRTWANSKGSLVKRLTLKRKWNALPEENGGNEEGTDREVDNYADAGGAGS